MKIFFMISSLFISLLGQSYSKCPTYLTSMNQAHFYLSDDVLDANLAIKQCSSFSGYLPNTYDGQISTQIIATLEKQFRIPDLQTVYSFNESNGYGYNTINFFNNRYFKPSSPTFKLYKRSTGTFSQALYFCNLINKARLPTSSRVQSSQCTNGWTNAFKLFGGNSATLGAIPLYVYRNSRHSTKLSFTNESSGNYQTPEAPIYIPDIYVFVGARSGIGRTNWIWSNGIITVPNSLYTQININTCQQMTYRYYNEWSHSPQSCSNKKAFYICEIEFNIESNADECNSSILEVTWNTEYYSQSSLHDEVLFVNIAHDGNNNKANFSSGKMRIENLHSNTTYNIKASLETTSCKLTQVSSSIIATTSYGIPDPVSSASIQNSTNTSGFHCVIEWSHDVTDTNILGYKIYITGSNSDPFLQISANDSEFANSSGTMYNYVVPIGLNLLKNSNFAYYFEIAAYSCEGVSNKTSVAGNCATPESQNTNSFVSAISVVVVLLLLLILLLVGIFIYKRRQAKKLPLEQTSGNLSFANQTQNSASVEYAKQKEVKVKLPHQDENVQTAQAVLEPIYANNLQNEYEEFGTIGLFLDCMERNFKEKMSNNYKLFDDEFQFILRSSPQKPNDVAALQENAKRNRYKNIYPYDDFRVILKTDPENNYINAAYIEGYKSNEFFIASQGPKISTVPDFWRMIWEQNTSVIVMLCNLKENEKTKCARYWTTEGTFKTFGEFKVKTNQQEFLGGIVKRTIWITYIPTSERKKVTQFQLVAWPDHGIPLTTGTLMNLHRMVKEATLNNRKYPVVVHCSAGAGRTGTFIATDILFDEMKEKSSIDVQKTVLKLRESRKDMVQTKDQYVFIHKLLMERYLFPETDVGVATFKTNKYDKDWLIKVAKEFELLSRSPSLSCQEYSTMYISHSKEAEYLPYDNNMVSVVEDSTAKWTYLNASYIKSPYFTMRSLIAAQCPNKGNEEDFWRMVLANNVTCLIMLEGKNSGLPTTSTNNGSCYGEITIQVDNEQDFGEYVEKTLIVFASKGYETRVNCLHFTNWLSDDSPPTNSVINHVITTADNNKNQQNTGSILVCCRNGSVRTGTFIALMNLIKRLGQEHRIDVFRTVKDLRDQRPGMVNNQKMYEYCYSFMEELIRDHP